MFNFSLSCLPDETGGKEVCIAVVVGSVVVVVVIEGLGLFCSKAEKILES